MAHWVVLHTKYQCSRPSGFKQDDCVMFSICQFELCDLHDGALLTTAPQFEQTR